jgi:hypothetical protein
VKDESIMLWLLPLFGIEKTEGEVTQQTVRIQKRCAYIGTETGGETKERIVADQTSTPHKGIL